MLAQLADPLLHEQILRRRDLVFEPKYDGMRAVIAIDVEPNVRIYSRLGNDKTEQFPEIVEPLLKVGRRLLAPVVVDGELVAVDDDGQALGFQHLQGRLHVRGLKSHGASRAVSVAFIAFDLLREGDTRRPTPTSFLRAAAAARGTLSPAGFQKAAADREHAGRWHEAARHGQTPRMGRHRGQGTPAPQGFLGHLIAREFSQEECRDGEARSGIGGGGSP